MFSHIIFHNFSSVNDRGNCLPVSGAYLELTEKRCDQNKLLRKSENRQNAVESFSLLHADHINIQTLHGSGVNLWSRYYLYMSLLKSVHIFNFSIANR